MSFANEIKFSDCTVHSKEIKRYLVWHLSRYLIYIVSQFSCGITTDFNKCKLSATAHICLQMFCVLEWKLINNFETPKKCDLKVYI